LPSRWVELAGGWRRQMRLIAGCKQRRARFGDAVNRYTVSKGPRNRRRTVPVQLPRNHKLSKQRHWPTGQSIKRKPDRGEDRHFWASQLGGRGWERLGTGQQAKGFRVEGDVS
jgi:hypothetical protein